MLLFFHKQLSLLWCTFSEIINQSCSWICVNACKWCIIFVNIKLMLHIFSRPQKIINIVDTIMLIQFCHRDNLKQCVDREKNWCQWQLKCINILSFSITREHAEKAISIITQILPENHLLLASSRRVKGMYLCI